MLIFLSYGRLGNQLFQYAFLATVAQPEEWIVTVNMKSLVDTVDLARGRMRHLTMRRLPRLTREVLVPWVLAPLARWGVIGGITQCRSATRSRLPQVERTAGWLPITFVAEDFFQSESLFDTAVKQTIRLKPADAKAADEFLQAVPPDATPVFVHVRRGDYVSEVFMGTRGIVLPASYYRKAFDRIRAQVSRPFFVFLSDDPDYVEDVFADVEPQLISRNTLGVDLAIMSKCRAAIISNSSFSWWGSALIPHHHVVLAPRYWYGWKQRVHSHEGIYPRGAELIDP